MKIDFKKNAGFTVIEVMVSLAIVIFGLFGIFDLYMNSLNVQTHSEKRINSITLAQNKIEQLKALGYDRLQHYVGPSKEQNCQISITKSLKNPDIINIEVSVTYEPKKLEKRKIVLNDIAVKEGESSI